VTQFLQTGYLFCVLITVKLHLYRLLTFNNIHAPTTNTNITSVCLALSGIDKRRCNCLLYLSNTNLIKKQFHLHLLFSIPCLKHVPMNQGNQQAVWIQHCHVYQISILHNCYIWQLITSSGMLSIPSIKKIATLGSLYECITHYYPHNQHSWLEYGTTADSINHNFTLFITLTFMNLASYIWDGHKITL
jgi:hypothetical protein